jgi:hypothetical protein
MKKDSAPERTRTVDLRLRRPLRRFRNAFAFPLIPQGGRGCFRGRPSPDFIQYHHDSQAEPVRQSHIGRAAVRASDGGASCARQGHGRRGVTVSMARLSAHTARRVASGDTGASDGRNQPATVIQPCQPKASRLFRVTPGPSALCEVGHAVAPRRPTIDSKSWLTSAREAKSIIGATLQDHMTT